VADILAVNPVFDSAMVRQSQAMAVGRQEQFARHLAAAVRHRDAGEVERKVSEALAVALLGPVLLQMTETTQPLYFLSSRAEQAYRRQMYLEVVQRIGGSDAFPIGRKIAKAMLRNAQA